MSVFTLPDLGEGLQEAEVVAWHVAPGEHIAADQPLVSVETEKAVVEIPAPRAGRVKALLAEVGERLAVGAPLMQYEEGADEDAGAVVGELERAAPSAPAAQAPAGPKSRAAPAVRRLATELGVDLAAVEGTGEGGALTRADVERAAEKGAPAAAGEPLRGTRRVMARNMAASNAEVAAATIMDDADIEDWIDPEAVLPRLVRAVASAAAAEPALNAWFDAAGERVLRHATVDLAIAVDSPEGLFAPVLRGAEGLDAAEVVERLGGLIAGVRARSLPPTAFQGATITLSNFGALGGRYAALAVTPPQVAILGAGKAAPRFSPSDDGRGAFRRLLPLSLTVDHRVVTGGEAARFLAAAIVDLKRPD
ncbi:MAG: 2-oxo acid dehydrogenase subunit E2 [Alphaproteobacteria bacterium]|nr:2-oxo acid dehydrogenase subunit E2 [Alphaproteobacteria bacterium]